MTTAPSSRPARAWLGATLLASLLLGAAAPAQEELQDRMRAVASGLRCPVCQNLSVAESTSELARDMRALIIDQLKAGKSPEEIRAYFVSKYGQWILLSPTPRGVGLVVWVLPALAALAGVGGATWALRRWARHPTPPPRVPVDAALLARVRAAVAADEPAPALTAEEARLVDALRELEFDYRAGKLSPADYLELRALYERRAAAALAAPRCPPREEEAPRRVREAIARPMPRVRAWRWAAAALFLVGFGGVVGFFLPQAVRLRGEGSITGDFLTGTAAREPDPRDLHGLLVAGQQALEAGDFGRATRLFTRALELDPEEPTAHASMGLLLLRGGHAEQALRAFDRALAREPTSPQALWGRGLVLFEAQGKPAEAVQTWEKLLAQELSKEDREHVLSMLARAKERLAAKAAPAAGPAP